MVSMGGSSDQADLKIGFFLQLWPEIPVISKNKNPIYRMYNPIYNL